MYLGIPLSLASPASVSTFAFYLFFRILLIFSLSQLFVLVVVFYFGDLVVQYRLRRRKSSFYKRFGSLTAAQKTSYENQQYFLSRRSLDVFLGGRMGLVSVATCTILCLAFLSPSLSIVMMYIVACLILFSVTIGKTFMMSLHMLKLEASRNKEFSQVSEDLGGDLRSKAGFLYWLKSIVGILGYVAWLTKRRIGVNLFSSSPYLYGFFVATALFSGAVSSRNPNDARSTEFIGSAGDSFCGVLLSDLGGRFFVIDQNENLRVAYQDKISSIISDSIACREGRDSN
jgi:hypothetical protein